ncbi:MAG: hypothetical protein JWM09_840 [Francisellaceae bacterium]|nr:hypothetical protein [Francisellaceae bacterium]
MTLPDNPFEKPLLFRSTTNCGMIQQTKLTEILNKYTFSKEHNSEAKKLAIIAAELIGQNWKESFKNKDKFDKQKVTELKFRSKL